MENHIELNTKDIKGYLEKYQFDSKLGKLDIRFKEDEALLKKLFLISGIIKEDNVENNIFHLTEFGEKFNANEADIENKIIKPAIIIYRDEIIAQDKKHSKLESYNLFLEFKKYSNGLSDYEVKDSQIKKNHKILYKFEIFENDKPFLTLQIFDFLFVAISLILGGIIYYRCIILKYDIVPLWVVIIFAVLYFIAIVGVCFYMRRLKDVLRYSYDSYSWGKRHEYTKNIAIYKILSSVFLALIMGIKPAFFWYFFPDFNTSCENNILLFSHYIDISLAWLTCIFAIQAYALEHTKFVIQSKYEKQNCDEKKK